MTRPLRVLAALLLAAGLVCALLWAVWACSIGNVAGAWPAFVLALLCAVQLGE